MDLVTVIGLIAGVLTTIASLPQIIKTWKLKHTGDISLGMYAILVAGVFLWLVYGILIMNLPLIAANSISLILVSIVLVFKLRYG